MSRLAKYMTVVIATALLATAAPAQPPTSGGQIIPLYPAGIAASLGVSETREKQKNGDTMIFDGSESKQMMPGT